MESLTTARYFSSAARQTRLMALLLTVFPTALVHHLIHWPFDGGANVAGARLAPATLETLGASRILQPSRTLRVHPGESLEEVREVYEGALRALQEGATPITFGGDHTAAIGSVPASQRYAEAEGYRLGVLWVDAHPDFHTSTTSSSSNPHGMALAAACGHTLSPLHFGPPVPTQNVLLHGVRDIDGLESVRLQEHDLRIARNNQDVFDWATGFDKLHVSFDVDAIDPAAAPGVSTPVPGGLTGKECTQLLRTLASTGKVLALDVVELNPLRDVKARTANLLIELLTEYTQACEDLH